MTMTRLKAARCAIGIVVGGLMLVAMGWLSPIDPALAARAGAFVAPEPYRAFASITKSDTTTYGVPGATNPRPIEALFIGTSGGDVALVGQDQSAAVTIAGIPAGTILVVSPYKIMSTNTTATVIIALYR